MPEVVEGDLRQSRPREHRREGTLTQIGGVDGVPGLPGEDETPVPVDTTGLQLVLCTQGMAAYRIGLDGYMEATPEASRKAKRR